MAVVHKVTLFLVHEMTLFAVCIETTKAVISLSVNIKPIRHTTSTLRAHQVYRVFRNLQEHYGSSDRTVATVIELLELPL